MFDAYMYVRDPRECLIRHDIVDGFIASKKWMISTVAEKTGTNVADVVNYMNGKNTNSAIMAFFASEGIEDYIRGILNHKKRNRKDGDQVDA